MIQSNPADKKKDFAFYYKLCLFGGTKINFEGLSEYTSVN